MDSGQIASDEAFIFDIDLQCFQKRVIQIHQDKGFNALPLQHKYINP